MVHPILDDKDEKPLDPAVARVEVRLRRLMLIGGLTLGIGLLAVLAAIVYRIGTSADKVAAVPVYVDKAEIPADAQLVSTAMDGGRIALTYQHPGGTTVILVDARTLAVIGRLDLRPE
jgi:hypothetical protein